RARCVDGGCAAAAVASPTSTSVVAVEDLMAGGVIAGLAEAGLRGPADMSVPGCDDVLLARPMTPSLSTITAPIEDLGHQAVSLLERAMAGEPPQSVRLEGVLTLRGTSGKARQL